MRAEAPGDGTHVLENEGLRLVVSEASGSLLRVVNKGTSEAFAVAGDAFAVQTLDGAVTQDDCRVAGCERTSERVLVRFDHARLTADVEWRVHPKLPFAEKQVTVAFKSDAGWTRMVVSRPSFSGSALRMVCYRYPNFDRIENTPLHRSWKLKRQPGTEPVKTYFGRTDKGGFFAGLEMPFDSSALQGQTAELSFSPNLKMKAGERHVCESMYVGVYRRGPWDARAEEWLPTDAAADSTGEFDGAAAAGLATSRSAERATAAAVRTPEVLPLPSESAAMVAVSSAILGPPRHGLMAFACSWHCQMEQEAYDSDEKLEGDLRALEFLAACGLDGVSESHPWGGETAKMAALREGDRYTPDARVRRFLEHARQLGLKVPQWPTMNNTHPWRTYGGPFRPDRPEWLRGVEGAMLGGANADNFRQRKANCLACEPFCEWWTGIQMQALATGLFDSWSMDGDFWGTGAYYHTTVPVTCTADNHRHLPGDSNYACQRALDRIIAEVRRAYPDFYIAMCRPPMDLGVWSNRNVDACFTLIETGTGDSNIASGDEIRTASRIRVHQHFFPHTLDWPLLFPSYGDPKRYPKWPSEKIDYIMLSALSSSPNLLLYLPARTGIPKDDQAEIRRWLDWGRKNVKYLLVRRDLFDWPGKGKVDGSAHIVGDGGIVFLFNGGKASAAGSFTLSDIEIGLAERGRFEVSQEYPPSGAQVQRDYGETVTWDVPAESAVVLRLRKGAGG